MKIILILMASNLLVACTPISFCYINLSTPRTELTLEDGCYIYGTEVAGEPWGM
jgi:hypothetical protein